ncbi:glycoside hydrolase family 16 protein [Mesobacillus subterraneus]|uniref:Glycoside hydrolase family 16 protein n=1 Tax=Mesobacillus subterraneus TaxID=285983 RepID=A0A3R9F139_9BACI|nr:glycoside hydrolase family 16 protein [Mesobacillus subterraneus]RSD26799.1 glycoside hydrolase family 16 protein [Mesobacillus subterraneus]
MKRDNQNDSMHPALNTEMMALSKTEGSWRLVWEDSFSEPVINQDKWNFVEGGWGFGNEESQFYTARAENARIEDGKLILEARKEAYQGMEYTSAKLTTRGKAAWKYGRFSISAKLPEGQGIWPAIWMMPEDMERYTGWPACGEIDIMEQIGHEPGTVYGTLHYGVPHTYTSKSYSSRTRQNFRMNSMSSRWNGSRGNSGGMSMEFFMPRKMNGSANQLVLEWRTRDLLLLTVNSICS